MARREFLDLGPLLSPRGIAVVGASPRGNRGSRVLENLERFGYPGPVWVVHPHHDRVLGYPTVARVADLPAEIDLVLVAVQATRAVDAVREAAEREIRAVVVIGSGFGEGDAGTDHATELAELVAAHGLVLCGPNCYGVLDVAGGVAAYSGRVLEPLQRGNVALLMQSGALTHAVTDPAAGRGFGLSALITTGNEIGVQLSDYLAWYADDPRTQVIGVFAEGIRDGTAFAEAARRAREQAKAVVVLSSGRSEVGRQAALAHTGAVSGGAAALDGLLAQVGAVRVDDLDEFRETLLLFSHLLGGAQSVGPDLIGRAAGQVAMLSISGGACGLVADLAESVGLTLAPFGADVAQRLKEVLPEFAAVNNPLDVTGAAAEDTSILRDSLRAVATGADVAATVFVMNVGQPGPGQEEFYRAQARILAQVAQEAPTPLVLLTASSGTLHPELARICADGGVAVTMGLRPGARALSAWLAWQNHVPRSAPAALPRQPWPTQGGVVAGQDALRLLTTAGITVPRAALARTFQEAEKLAAELTGPFALKIESPDIAHKTEVRGVRLQVPVQEVAEATAQLLQDVRAAQPQARLEGVLVQEMAPGNGLECLVGVIDDPQAGLSMSIAPGGVLTELTGPAAARPIPLSERDVEELLDSSMLTALLAGYRGSPQLDRPALVRTAVAFSQLVAALPDVAAAEINPLLVGPVDRGTIAVDGLFIPRDARS